jgi:lysozyme
MEDIKQWIKKHEGLKLEPYLDSLGNLTIGVGRCLSLNGISKEEAEYLLENDIREAIRGLQQYSWYVVQPAGVQMALINMCFNLGLPKLLGFRKMIKGLIDRDYEVAAAEALDSRWALQVKGRSEAVADKIRAGK